jgi:hypothetical protein
MPSRWRPRRALLVAARSWLGVVAFALLAARAFHGLGPAPPVRPQVVGVQEVVWGVHGGPLAVGYRAGL